MTLLISLAELFCCCLLYLISRSLSTIKLVIQNEFQTHSVGTISGLYMFNRVWSLIGRWRTIEQVFGFLRYYVIILYYVVTFIYLYYGVPTLFNVLHLLLLCSLVIRQILYKETISQWIYSGVAFFLIFITKQALHSSHSP